jgi:sugar/nucleoside kinase (ribokinase family)
VTSLRLRPDPRTRFTQVVGIGGIGTGIIFALQGNHTLGRNESRMGAVVDARDYCKLHIVEHYIAALLGLPRNCRSFEVIAVGNVGADASGTGLLREMKDAGINIRYVRVEPDSPTMFSTVFFYPDKSGGNITASNSANSMLNAEQLAECQGLLEKASGRSIALCLPEVPLDKRQEFLRIAMECGSYRVASFASEELKSPCELKLLANVDLLALNREEAMELAGSGPRDLSETQMLDACSERATSMNPSMKIIVSAGPEGAYAFESGHWSKHQAIATDAISTAGAGDALLAGTIAGLIAGMPLTGGNGSAADGKRSIGTAIDLGLTLAAFGVTSPHTIHPEATLENLLHFAETKQLLVPQAWYRSSPQ